ncbi:MAG: DUF3795 domain-containing protein, partial [Planctomycetota bacterium]
EFNLRDADLIAPCGLYCGECSAFQNGGCGGCISRKGLSLKYTKICKIYSCCADERGLRVCSECEEFPCGRFAAFFASPAWYNEVVANLRRIEKNGRERFLEEQARRVNQLIRCAGEHDVVHCSLCKEWPCSKLNRPPLTPA